MRQGAPTEAGQITAEAWTAMNDAAQRAGLPLDRWLQQRLLGPAGARGEAAGDIADLRRRIQELTRSLAGAAESLTPPAGLATATSRVETTLDDIRAQLDALATDPGARLRPTESRPVEPRPIPAPRKPEAPSPASIEAAVAEIAARQRELEIPARPAAGPSPAAPKPAGATPPDLDALRAEIAGLRSALGDLAPRQAVDELQRTVSRLAGRVEASGLRDKELCATLTALRDMIATLRLPEYQSVMQARIDALGRKLDLLAARQVDGAAIARLQAQTGEIRNIIGRALSNDTVRQLVEQVTLLVSRVSREAGAGESALRAMLASVDERLGQIAARIEAQAARPVEVDFGGVYRRLDDIQKDIAENIAGLRREAPADMEAMLRGLSERLERIERPLPVAGAVAVPDSAAFEALSRQITALADRLEAQHPPSGRLAGIERALNDLFIQMEETRASLVSTAPPPAPSDPSPRGSEPPAAAETATPSPSPEASAPPAADAAPATPAAEAGTDEADQPEAPIPTPAHEAPAEPAAGPARPTHPPAWPLSDSRPAGKASPRPSFFEEAAADADAVPEGPPRIDFIAQARRAARGPHPGATAVPTIGRLTEGRANRARSTRWLARLRAMLLVGICGSALAFASWHLLSGMKEGRLRAGAPAGTSTARTVPAQPTPDDITGSVTPRPAAPPALAPPAPEAPAAPPAPLPGSSSLEIPGDLPGAIGSQGLRAAALAGDPAAAYEIGHRYLEGEGVAPSAPRAAEWFDVAAARGFVPAAYRLGALYEKGAEGVPRDLARARALYELAAKGGNVRAMHNLGVLLADGRSGAPDYAAAAVWFRQAAGHGVRDSQYNLGVLYSRGSGVEVDLVQAWRWFSLAAQRGDTEAAAKRDDIAARLDPETLAAARKALQKWTPAEIDARANGGSDAADWDQSSAPMRKTASRS